MKTIILFTTLFAATLVHAETYQTWGNQIQCKVKVSSLFPTSQDRKTIIRQANKEILLQLDPNPTYIASARGTLQFPDSNAEAKIYVVYKNYESKGVASKEKQLLLKATMTVDGAVQSTAQAWQFAQSTEKTGLINRFSLISRDYQQMDEYQWNDPSKRLSLLNIAQILFPKRESIVTEMDVYCNAVPYERTQITPKF